MILYPRKASSEGRTFVTNPYLVRKDNGKVGNLAFARCRAGHGNGLNVLSEINNLTTNAVSSLGNGQDKEKNKVRKRSKASFYYQGGKPGLCFA